MLWQFTLRNIELRHRGSLLGLTWAVLNPLVMLALYVFIFGYVFGGQFGMVENESRWDYGMGIFVGLTVYHLVAETLATAPTVVVNSPNFVKKVVFPVEILPAAAVGAGLFHMLISLVLALIGAVLGGRFPGADVLLLPVVLLPIMFCALGLAWLTAALGVFFRDIGQFVTVLTTGLMFASAVFYPVSRIPEGAWVFLRFNPLIHVITMTRDVILWHRSVDPGTILLLYLSGAAVMTFGYAAFSRLKRSFADVI